MDDSSAVGLPVAIPFSTSAALIVIIRLESKLSRGLIDDCGKWLIRSAMLRVIARSPGSGLGVNEAGVSRERPLRPGPAVIWNGSTGATVRVVFGRTVLLSRSAAVFSGSGARTIMDRGASGCLPKQALAFLNKSRKGMVMNG